MSRARRMGHVPGHAVGPRVVPGHAVAPRVMSGHAERETEALSSLGACERRRERDSCVNVRLATLLPLSALLYPPPLYLSIARHTHRHTDTHTQVRRRGEMLRVPRQTRC